MARLLASVVLALSASIAWADATEFVIEELHFTIPDGWTMKQRAQSAMTHIVSAANGKQSLVVYSQPKRELPLNSFLSSDSRVVEAEKTLDAGPLTWRYATSVRAPNQSPQPERRGRRQQPQPVQQTTVSTYVTAFTADYNETTYYGFGRSDTPTDSADLVKEFLGTVRMQLMLRDSESENGPVQVSLTEPDQVGKKYYLGWGSAMVQDPAVMQNEVKYDVQHTHDIFTKSYGGDYVSATFIGGQARGNAVQDYWRKLLPMMTPDDMYVQYSSGHGSETGLEIGMSYRQIRDQILALPAREIIVFMMACHSGAIVDAFNEKKSEWQDWASKGRTLMVLASSRASELSQGGPGRDSAEPNGPNGSAGSAFGWALWKSLIGGADGATDGIKDGFISLGEIRDYSRAKTRQLAGHTPVETGTYFPHLIMNRVPSADAMKAFTGGSENLTEGQLRSRIRSLDEELRVTPHRPW